MGSGMGSGGACGCHVTGADVAADAAEDKEPRRFCCAPIPAISGPLLLPLAFVPPLPLDGAPFLLPPLLAPLFLLLREAAVLVRSTDFLILAQPSVPSSQVRRDRNS
jgi:hypothetical protein